MVEIKRIGIKRKVYRLEVRRKYSYTKTFKVRKREPIDDLRDALKSLLAPKSKKAAAAPPVAVPPSALPPAPPNHRTNLPLILGAVLLALLLIGGMWIYLSGPSLGPAAQPPAAIAIRPHLQNRLLETGAVTAGDRSAAQYIAYIRTQAATQGISNYSLTITPYAQPMPSELFILTSHRVQAERYPEFAAALREDFGRYHLPVNEIDIDQLAQAPTPGILIVPSGNIPKELLGIDSPTDFVRLVQKGWIIVYIGLPFNNMLDGELVVSTPASVYSALGIGFQEGAPAPSNDFSIFQPLYRLGGVRGLSGGGTLYGSVSYATGPAGGAIIFLPQTLDGGWPNRMEGAAGNVTRLVLETRWATPLDNRTYQVTPPDPSRETGRFFSLPLKIPYGSLKLEWAASDASGALADQEWRIASFRKGAPGELFVQGGYVITPTYITGQPVRMNIKFNETEPGTRALFLVITNSTAPVGDRIGRGQMNLIGEVPFDIPVHLDSGEYIASMVDDADRVYAQTYLQVASVDILYTGQPARGSYSFAVRRGQAPEPLDMAVMVDGGQYGTYRFNRTTDVTVDVKSLTGGEDLPYMNHTFTFQLGTLAKSVVVPPPPRSKSFFDDPLFLATFVLAAGIVGIGVYFGRREDVRFQLDVPDFPPIARTKIPLRSETLLGLFEKVNADYRWELVPLSLSEVKNGFKGLLHDGKPILISDYNTEYLLDQLKAKGLLASYLDYYLPTSWEKRSGKSARYLCLFRRLRDVFVNNAVPFTQRGEAPDCDTRITIVGQDMYVHLFDGFGGARFSSAVTGALRSAHQGISMIVFGDEEEKEKFAGMLSSTSAAMLILSMEVASGSVMLLTHAEFEKTVREFKIF